MKPSLPLLLLLALSALPCPPARADAPAAEDVLVQGKPLAHWVDLLKEPDLLAREESLEVLAQAGPAAKAALPAVRPLLNAEPLTLRFRAALAVCKLGGDAAPAVPIFAEVLAEPNR